MTRNRFALPAILLALIVLAGCGSASADHPSSTAHAAMADGHTATAASVAAAAPRMMHAQPAAVRVAGTRYGRALVDPRGFALYLFTRDPSRSSACSGACAAAWPPYLVHTRHPAAGRGTAARLLGTVRRPDGRLQLTYAGHPLYHYVGDKQPGAILCQAAAEFGGTWYVVSPAGGAIT
jgi:predicted lipoprotein with Yx(FWY)xxD motif